MALLDYDQDAAHGEITGWISHRGQGPAAVQLIDACAGLEADAALRRLAAVQVLAELDETRALAGLCKAVVSGVLGCAETAAIALADRGEITRRHGPELQWRELVDHLWGPLGVADGTLAMFLEGGSRCCPSWSRPRTTCGPATTPPPAPFWKRRGDF